MKTVQVHLIICTSVKIDKNYIAMTKAQGVVASLKYKADAFLSPGFLIEITRSLER